MKHLEANHVDMRVIHAPTTAGANTRVPGLGLTLLKIVLQFVFMGGVLLVAAGTLYWVRAWIYLGVGLSCLAVNASIVLRINPQAIVERHKKHEDTKTFDKVLTRIIMLATFGTWIVAGMDAVRFGWSSISAGWLYAGVALHLLGMAAICWCLATNPYLEKSVRIQADRDQRVITTGPYGFIRHPMYLAMIVMMLGCPLILGSAWAFLPVAICIVLFVLRTALEDRTLRRELRGYEEYTQATRCRLLPGIW